MAIERNITADDKIFTGEDKTITGTIYQADGTTPQNITGWSISWMLKKSRHDVDGSAKITKTTASGITITNAANGAISIALTDTDLSIPAGTYVHELKRTNDGSETVLTFGTFVLRQSVHGA